MYYIHTPTEQAKSSIDNYVCIIIYSMDIMKRKLNKLCRIRMHCVCSFFFLWGMQYYAMLLYGFVYNDKELRTNSLTKQKFMLMTKTFALGSKNKVITREKI